MRDTIDSPVVSPEADLFRMAPFAKRIARLLRTAPPEGGLVVGLSGEPGSGKASLTNMASCWLLALDQAGIEPLSANEDEENDAMGALLRPLPLPVTQDHLARLERQSGRNGRTLILRYDPWPLSGQSVLISDFFRKLGGRLADLAGPLRGTAIRQAAFDFATRLDATRTGEVVPAASPTRLGSKTLPFWPWRRRAATPAGTLEESWGRLYQAIEGLTDLGPVVVIAENLSRLAPGEARAFLAMINGFGRLPRVNWLLSYDSDRLRQLLGEDAEWLDKTISVPVEIPRPAPLRLLEAVISRSQNLFGEAMSEAERQDLLRPFRDVPPPLLSPRMMMRLSGSLAFADVATGRSLRKSDLIRLELLKLVEPSVHRWVMRNALSLNPRGARALKATGRERSFLDSGLSLADPSRREAVSALLLASFPALAAALDALTERIGDRLPGAEIRTPLASAEGLDLYLRATPTSGVITPDEWLHASQIRNEPARARAFLHTLMQRRRDDGRPLLFTFLAAIDRLPISDGEPFGLLQALVELPDAIVAESADGSHRSGLRDALALMDYFDTPDTVLQAIALKDGTNPFAIAVLLEALAERAGLIKSGLPKAPSRFSEQAIRDAIATVGLRIASLPPERVASWFATVDLHRLLMLGLDPVALLALVKRLLSTDNEALRFFLQDACNPWPDGSDIVLLLTRRPDPEHYPLADMQAYALRMFARLPGDRFFGDFADAAAEFLSEPKLTDRSQRIRRDLKA